MDVRLPDGTIIQNVPDGTTKADLVSRLQRNGVAVPSEWLAQEKPQQVSERVGSALSDIPRQVGLTARYGMEGLGRVADVFTEPVRYLMNRAGIDSANQSTSQLASSAANALGLPQPQTADERVVGDATRALAGAAGGVAGAGRVAASLAPSTAKVVASRLSAAPVTQGIGAASGGLAGGSVREAGGSDAEQFAAALAGGVAGGVGANALSGAVQSGVRAARNALTPQTTMTRQADQQISLILERSGVDWSQVPERVRQGMRQEVADALQTGRPLDADAVRRLLVFRETGTTPTVGMLTQDPGLITREMNLAKTGANSTDVGLQRLPQIQNQNTQALLRRLDEAGAEGAPNAFATGQRVIDSLQMRQDAARNAIDAAYEAARGTAGRQLPMNGAEFTKRANALIDEAMVGHALPQGVANTMNRIATGEMPFTVDIAEQLKTQVGKLSRNTSDGQQRYALGLVRRALDETPVAGTERVNPGNLPAVPGTVQPSVAGQADEALQAFADARRTNAQWMARVEANPALRAVVDGVEPDQFVSRFIVNKGASARDLQAMSAEIGPDATNAIKQYLVRYLRDAATNSTDDITKFSNDAYRRALRNLGDEKLSAFFSADELRNLRNVGEAAKYMQAQPTGTAVNNSNSGAMMLGRGLDALDAFANYIPLGGKDVIKGAIQGAQQSQTLRTPNALALPPVPMERANPFMAGLLASPVDARENNRREKRP